MRFGLQRKRKQLHPSILIIPSFLAPLRKVHTSEKQTPQPPSHQSLPRFPQPESLTPPGIIKEEPNSAQQPALSLPNGSCPALLDRTWSLSHHLAAAWGNEQMYPHQKCAHSSGPIRHTDISNRIDCVSRFESKSFLENILESNAGGEGGNPPGMASVSVSTCARSSGLI